MDRQESRPEGGCVMNDLAGLSFTSPSWNRSQGALGMRSTSDRRRISVLSFPRGYTACASPVIQNT
jgi:hypothetical protein